MGDHNHDFFLSNITLENIDNLNYNRIQLSDSIKTNDTDE